MKLPRDISARELLTRLRRLDYEVERQTGSHIQLRRETGGKQHITVPAHTPLKVGTLSAIVRLVAQQVGLPREEVIRALFD